MLLLFRLKNCCIFVSESYWWTIKTFNSKIHNKIKKEFLLKTQNPTCWDYALKSDDDSKNRTKPISRNYAVKSDDDPKTNKTNILVYAVKSDDDSKNRTKINIPELCCKKRWWSKDQQTNILVYAVKSDNDTKIKSLKPDKSFIRFSGALTTQNFKSWNSWLKLALQNVDFHRLWKTSSLWKSFF